MKFGNSQVSPSTKTPLSLLLLLLLVLQELPLSSASPRRGASSEVKCVCDGSCEHLRAKDCPFGLTFDMCRCCLVCARGEDEPCGGALGNCAIGLHCINKEDDGVNETSVGGAAGIKDDQGRCTRKF
jgi:hypothetical protein